MSSERVKITGLSNAFFSNPPYSPSTATDLARRSLQELQDLETNQRQTSVRLIDEAQRSREVSERMIAPLLRDLAHGNLGIQERIQELGAALSKGNQQLSSTLADVGGQISGIPKEAKSFEDIMSSGDVNEMESIILAAKGALNKDQTKRFFDSLDPWKIWIISNLSRIDGYIENGQLSNEEKEFFYQLMRKADEDPINFKSLSEFARHGLLDAAIHHALAERIPEVRFGIEGVKYEVRDLSRKASALVSQGNVQIGLQRRIADNSSIGVTQREEGLELMERGILQTEELTDVTRESLVVQKDIRLIGEATLDKVENLGDLAVAAASDRQITIDSIQHYGEVQVFQMDEAQMARLAQLDTTHHFGELQVAQMNEAQRTRLAQLNIARHFGEVQVFQMNEAQITRSTQLDTTRHYGEVQANQMDTSNRIAEMHLRELLNANEGLSVLRAIALAHLNTTRYGGALQATQMHEAQGTRLAQLDALGQLKETLSSGVSHITEVIGAVRQTLMDMEARAIDRERNSERNLGAQSFQKAMTMLRTGNIDKAIEFFNESENRWPDDFALYFQRGLCHILKDDPRAAESDFSDAISLASGKDEVRTRSLIRLNLARLYYSEAKVSRSNSSHKEYEEKLQAAIKEAKKAVEEDPNFLEAQFGLATYLAANKSLNEALRILISIIPENPDFIRKLDYFDVFTPLRASLKNTLGKKGEALKGNDISQANLSIAKDCIGLGDFETAKKCLNSLFKKDPEYLRQSKVWEIPEFAVLNDDIVEMAKTHLSNAGTHNSEWGYAAIAIALHYPKIARASIYKAFKIAIEKDPDFRRNNSVKIAEKLRFFTDDKIALLFEIAKTKFPRDLPEWLLKLH